THSAAFFFENCRIACASPTGLPRIRSTTSRILRGLCRLYLLMALASMAPLPGLRLLVRELAAMAPEQTRRRKLTELVPDHVLRHVDRHELVAVVHCERVAHELR